MTNYYAQKHCGYLEMLMTLWLGLWAFHFERKMNTSLLTQSCALGEDMKLYVLCLEAMCVETHANVEREQRSGSSQ